jgi:hypothetical protein
VALIVVLGFIALFAVVTTMMVTSSKTSQRNSKVLADRSEAKYAAESALAYSTWMLICDRRKFPSNRILGQQNLQRDPLVDDFDPWMADGQLHSLAMENDVVAEVRIFDANSGMDVSVPNSGTRMRQTTAARTLDDEELRETLDVFYDALDDYLDTDSNRRLNGFEAEDYQAEFNLYGFPRNRPMRFREEAYWLPNVGFVAPKLDDSEMTILPEDAFRLIPPGRMRFPTKPSFFSSSAGMLQQIAQLDGEETQIALQARRAWHNEQIPIQEGLGDIYGKVAGRMSMVETGIYTIEVSAGRPDSETTRRIVHTLDLRTLRTIREPPFLMLWQKVVY